MQRRAGAQPPDQRRESYDPLVPSFLRCLRSPTTPTGRSFFLQMSYLLRYCDRRLNETQPSRNPYR